MKNFNYAIQSKNLASFNDVSQKKCTNCKKNGKGIQCVICKLPLYCSQVCRSYDEDRHTRQQCQTNKSQYQYMNTASNSINNPNGSNKSSNSGKGTMKMGLVGLENIGNTCYLNSSLQCLSHTIPLTQYFYEKHYQKQINQKNFLGSNGVLAEAYANFILSMWYGCEQIYRPEILKKVIGKINPQFSKFSQEDANELLIMMIDIIHEDLNRILERPKSGKQLDVSGKSMEQAAKISWLHYCCYNQSIITDIMTGLFRSTIYCRTCKKQSSTFEPFRTINLPIPNENLQKQLKFHILYADFRKETATSTIQYKMINHHKLAEEAAKQIGEYKSKFKLYFLSEKNDICDCEKIQDLDTFQALMEDQQAFLIEMNSLEQTIIDRFQITCFFSRPGPNPNNNIWIKRPFFIGLGKDTGGTFQDLVLQYLYNSVYRYPEEISLYGATGHSFNEYMKLMREKKVLKFKLVKIQKRMGRTVVYEPSIEQQLQQNVLIFDSIKKLIKYQEQDEQLQKLQRYFELKIELTKQSDTYYNFSNLNLNIESKKCWKNKPKQYSSTSSSLEPEIEFQKCLDAFQLDQKLHSDIVWYCSECQEERKANKKISIYKTPDILIFVFNRFKVRQDLTKEKKKRPISVPFQINLQKYVVDLNPMSCFIDVARKKGIYKEPPYQYEPNKKPIQKFELYAFIQHEGEINQGHYSAYAKNNDQWYFFNDKKVQQVNQKKIKKNNAYILFYRRKKR